MLNKSIRPTKEDAIGIQKIIDGDIRVEKSPSEALFYAYKDAAENTPDWNQVKKIKFKDEDIDDQAYGNTMSFSVDEKDFEIVVESLKNQLGIDRVRISYMTRLCILAARMRLEAGEEKKPVKTLSKNDEIDRMARLAKYMELLQKASKSMKPELDNINEQIEKLVDKLD
ncbi:MAG: hypothetical protein IKZ94_01185 [Lachnospiraceae bacterium]|nr:hypothetical protein [Lachnospiraceae bacterium]